MNAVRAVPANLKDLLDSKVPGYELKPAYFLILDHGCMGAFPALINGTDRVILTTDADLIHDVWKTMTPRKSKIGTIDYYSNEEFSLGFPVLGSSDYDNERSKPQHILTRSEFESLTCDGRAAFHWAPGLVGNDMNQEEFHQTLEAARKKLVTANC